MKPLKKGVGSGSELRILGSGSPALEEMFQTINDPSPLSAAPLKKKRGRPRKIKVEEEDESFAEPLVTFKVKDKGRED